jgi:hypothetical protein
VESGASAPKMAKAVKKRPFAAENMVFRPHFKLDPSRFKFETSHFKLDMPQIKRETSRFKLAV